MWGVNQRHAVGLQVLPRDRERDCDLDVVDRLDHKPALWFGVWGLGFGV